MRLGVLAAYPRRSEEHTSELQSRENLVCRLLLEKKKRKEYPGRGANSNSTSIECANLKESAPVQYGILAFFFLMIRRPPRSTLFPLHDALPISLAARPLLLRPVPVKVDAVLVRVAQIE